jgi:hypothetical protein
LLRSRLAKLGIVAAVLAQFLNVYANMLVKSVPLAVLSFAKSVEGIVEEVPVQFAKVESNILVKFVPAFVTIGSNNPAGIDSDDGCVIVISNMPRNIWVKFPVVEVLTFAKRLSGIAERFMLFANIPAKVLMTFNVRARLGIGVSIDLIS